MLAKDIVLTAASVLGPTGEFVVHETRPKLGTVESLTSGTPPTDVIVVYEDGSRTEYPAVNDGAASVLYVVAGLSNPPIVGAVVQSKTGPNPGGLLQGPVVQQVGLEDPSGNAVGEVVVVQTPTGFLVIPTSDARVVASA